MPGPNDFRNNTGNQGPMEHNEDEFNNSNIIEDENEINEVENPNIINENPNVIHEEQEENAEG